MTVVEKSCPLPCDRNCVIVYLIFWGWEGGGRGRGENIFPQSIMQFFFLLNVATCWQWMHRLMLKMYCKYSIRGKMKADEEREREREHMSSIVQCENRLPIAKGFAEYRVITTYILCLKVYIGLIVSLCVAMFKMACNIEQMLITRCDIHRQIVR